MIRYTGKENRGSLRVKIYIEGNNYTEEPWNGTERDAELKEAPASSLNP